jgi:hypothetical protein
MVGGEGNRVEPELAGCALALRVHVHWLVAVKAVEEEAEGAWNAWDRRLSVGASYCLSNRRVRRWWAPGDAEAKSGGSFVTLEWRVPTSQRMPTAAAPVKHDSHVRASLYTSLPASSNAPTP